MQRILLRAHLKNMKTFFPGIILVGCTLLVWRCGDKESTVDETSFTKIDSLTDSYLSLQDSMLQSWNIMIHDDNQKITAMHSLLHELIVSSPDQREILASFEERLEQLVQMRYTQKTMANADVVEEYDFASNSLVTELIALTESQAQFNYNPTLQTLTDEIRTADQRVNIYREEYDAIVIAYNQFIEKNQADIKEIAANSSIEKRPLFQMVSED